MCCFDLFLLLFGAGFKCMGQQNTASERRLGHHAHRRLWDGHGADSGGSACRPHATRPNLNVWMPQGTWPPTPLSLHSVPESRPSSSLVLQSWKLRRSLRPHSPQVGCSIPPFDQRRAGRGRSERGYSQRGQGRVLQQCDGHLRELRRTESLLQGTQGGDSLMVGTPMQWLIPAPLLAFELPFGAPPPSMQVPPNPSQPHQGLMAVGLRGAHWVVLGRCG